MPSKRKAPVLPVYRQPSELDRLKNENRRLSDALFLTRESLIDLMDPQDLLSGYLGVRDDVQLETWRRAALTAVMETAQVRPGAEMGDPRWPRALCPLCRQGAQGARGRQGIRGACRAASAPPRRTQFPAVPDISRCRGHCTRKHLRHRAGASSTKLDLMKRVDFLSHRPWTFAIAGRRPRRAVRPSARQ